MSVMWKCCGNVHLFAISICTINTAWISAVYVILELSQPTRTPAVAPQVKFTHSPKIKNNSGPEFGLQDLWNPRCFGDLLALSLSSDYAVQIFHDALSTGHHECYLHPKTRLPMMHISDCHRATVEFMQAPECQLYLRTYNIAAISFTPEEVVEEIRKHLPHLRVTYKPDPIRQNIGTNQTTSSGTLNKCEKC